MNFRILRFCCWDLFLNKNTSKVNYNTHTHIHTQLGITAIWVPTYYISNSTIKSEYLLWSLFLPFNTAGSSRNLRGCERKPMARMNIRSMTIIIIQNDRENDLNDRKFIILFSQLLYVLNFPYIYTYICVYIYIHIHMCVYIHTHTYIINKNTRRKHSLGWEDSLQEGMATHSSILIWRITTDRWT